MKIRKCCYFQICFQYPYRFSVSIENHPCNLTKEKTYELFVYSRNIFPDIDLNEHINTILYLLRVILAMYMLDSDQEPSYNLSKNLLLLPMILKLIEDMVDDSTTL